MAKYIDAELLREKIEKTYKSEIAPWLSGVSATSAIYDYVLPLIDSLQQEQPEVDLEKEISMVLDDIDHKFFPVDPGEELSETDFINSLNRVARHFYNLGLNARKKE